MFKKVADESGGGLCFGMTQTAINLNSVQAPSDFYKDTVAQINKNDTSSSLGITALEYIKYLQAYQYSNVVSEYRKSTTNDLNGLYQAVKAYENGGGDGVSIGIHGRYFGDAGHAVWGIKAIDEDRYCKILVYDCNYPQKEKYLYLYKDETGAFISWSYDFDFLFTWGTGKKNASINYSTVSDDCYNVLSKVLDGITGIDYVWYDNLVVVEAGEILENELTPIYPYGVIIRPDITGDPETDEGLYDIPSLYWTKEKSITVESDSTGINTMLIGPESGIELTSTRGDRATVLLGDEGLNAVHVDSNIGDTISITFLEENIVNNSVRFTVSGTASSDIVSASNTTSGFQVIGLDNIVATLNTLEGEIDKDTVKVPHGANVEFTIKDNAIYDNVIPSLEHTITFVPAVSPTCKDTGIQAHWYCSACDKNFSDETATTELVDVIIPVDSSNHVGGTAIRDAKEATFEAEGYTGDTYCLGCGAKLADGTAIPKKTQSSGGGGGVSTYVITVDSAKNGDVTADRKTAAKGDTVTLTVVSDKGYTLETLTVVDKNGDKVKLTGKNGKYTFTMPASKVTVKATFMEDNSMLNFFVDVPVDAYYYDAVLWAAENGITGGTSDTTFSPNAPCTRAQIVTFLWRAAGSPVVNYAMNFTDVPADAHYAEAVRWAVSLGITTGTGNGMFSPDATCTRAQAMAFIYRSVQTQGGGMQGEWMFLNPFDDVNLESYYGEAVMWAVANGITSGTSDTTFSPNDDCTRAQIVTFLYRSMK